MPILCFGEAIVDLIAVETDGEALPSFEPNFGGALANAAVAAARAGAEVELAGGVGDDPLGRWLCERLVDEGVGLRWFSRLTGVPTAVALISFGAAREPSFSVHPSSIEPGLDATAAALPEAIAACTALVVGSNTLVGERERELTLGAVAHAAAEGKPVVFDPNLRPHRWSSLELARDLCLEVCRRSFAVRANLTEGAWLAGLAGPDDSQVPESGTAAEAAEALTSLGVPVSIVTRGARGAVLRGRSDAEHPGTAVDVVSPLGAGDAFTGTLAARLEALGWDAARAGEALPAAVEAGARACTVLEAVPPR